MRRVAGFGTSSIQFSQHQAPWPSPWTKRIGLRPVFGRLTVDHSSLGSFDS
jgi:hypothetical protein